jgi:ankyrin repeat protein
LDIAQWLLNHGASVNAQDEILASPLHDAAIHGQLEGVRILIMHNADVHLRNHLGATPLHLGAGPLVTASGSDYVGTMRVLLDYGADPNAQDSDRSTPLHYSSWWENMNYGESKGTVEGTLLLLKHGAIIDAEDNKGRTPLQLALEHGRDNIVTCLKEHGATR